MPRGAVAVIQRHRLAGRMALPEVQQTTHIGAPECKERLHRIPDDDQVAVLGGQ